MINKKNNYSKKSPLPARRARPQAMQPGTTNVGAVAGCGDFFNKLEQRKMSLGVDIEDIKRFSVLDRKKDKNFLERIYTKKELDYCYSKPKPSQHMAARFCAKEAIIKAFASKEKKINHKDIEIFNDRKGAPRARILKKNFARSKVEMSLSHDHDKAVAYVLCALA